MAEGWLQRLLGPFAGRRQEPPRVAPPRRAFVGRADLLRALAEGEDRLAQVAHLAGYAESRPKGQPSTPVQESQEVDAVSAPAAPSASEAPPVRMYRTVAVEYANEDPEPPSERQRSQFVLHRLPGSLPRSAALCRWSWLWPRLQAALCREVTGHEVDIERTLERLARVSELKELSRRRRKLMPRKVHLLAERSERLVPVWADQDAIYARLRRVLGSGRVSSHQVGGAPLLPRAGARSARLSRAAAAADEAVVVLGDVGVFGSLVDQWRWQQWAAAVRSSGAPLVVLVPAAASNPRFRRVATERQAPWQLIPWEEHSGRGSTLESALTERGTQRMDADPSAGAAEQLLGMLAPAVRIEPGLLRQMRRIAGNGLDCSAELAVWQHPDVKGGGVHGIWVDPERQRAHEAVFREQPPDLQRKVMDAIKHWRSGTRSEVWHEEVVRALGLGAAQGDEQGAVSAGDQAAAREFYTEFAHAVQTAAREGVDTQGLVAFFDRFTERSQAVWSSTPLERLLHKTWALVHQQEHGAVPPAGITPQDLEGGGDKAARSWHGIWQVGGELTLAGFNLFTWGDFTHGHRPKWHGLNVGSLVTGVESKGSALVVRQPGQRGQQQLLSEGQRARWSLPNGASVELVSDEATWTLSALEKPAWASALGRDRFGLFAEFEIVPSPQPSAVKGRSARPGAPAQPVVQRLRWINPGRFWMGSPESEPERRDDETRHLVTLTGGFWLADTACTQALWAAVVTASRGQDASRSVDTRAPRSKSRKAEQGSSPEPSRFKGPRRPVEQVSWEDCQQFLRVINEQVRGLELRLPTEAEWEYACRAGTETPFWFGDNVTPEEVNYDGNSPYAGGAKGECRGETVEVGSLPPNGWGLYELHGNVWEWCEDWYGGEYPQEGVTNPRGAYEGGFRVIRGGSWGDGGWFVRSACRGRFVPRDRGGSLGFRFARGP